MKLSTPTLCAILLSTCAVSAAPTAINTQTYGNQLIKKSEISDALKIIEEISHLNQKRELIEDEAELFELSKRADSLISQLLSALSSSGIITDVWSILTSDSDLKTEVVALVKSAISGLVTAAPSLISALWNSNLLQTVFSDIWNSDDLKSVLLSVAKSIFTTGLNLLKSYFSSSSKRELHYIDSNGNLIVREVEPEQSFDVRSLPEDFNAEEYYDKRDVLSVATSIYLAIKLTGIVQSLVEKALADPSASIDLLTTIFKKGWVLASDVYSWAEESGLLSKGLAWISANGATYASLIASFIGDLIVSGLASTDDVDNADTLSSATTTSTATTKVTSTATTKVTSTSTSKASSTTLKKKRNY